MTDRRPKTPKRWMTALVIGGFALSAVVGGGWVWWKKHDRTLSERPQRIASTLTLPKQTSSVHATATLSVQTIVDMLNKSAPIAFPGKGRQKVCAQLTEQIKKTIQKTIGGDVGKFLGEVTKVLTEIVTLNQTREVCQDVDFRYEVRRDGPFQIESLGGNLRLTAPISISGQAGFTGDLARALALDKKNFRGAIDLFVKTSVDLSSDWCPIINTSTTFSWKDKAQFEIVHKWWITIDDQIGPELQAALDRATDSLRSSLGCEDVRKAITPLWRPYTIPLALPGDQQATATLSLTPTRIGFSGIRYTSDQISLTLGLEAETEVVSGAIVPKMDDFTLPPLERIESNGNMFHIAIPARLGYEHLSEAIARILKDQPFETETTGGTVRLLIDAVEVYPSGEKLALAVHFAARMDNRLFDSKGWLFLLANPKLDEVNQLISLDDIEFTRQLDNDLWSIISAIFYDQILSHLEDATRFDIKPQIIELRKRLREGLGELSEQEKITVTINDTFVGLRDFNLAEQTLEVVVAFEGNAHVAMDAIPIL